jgi:Zn-dependent protease with chaperone function
MRHRGNPVLTIAVLTIALAVGFALSAARLGYETQTERKAEQFAAHNTTAYTLPPGKLERAVALDRTRMTLQVAGEAWTLGQLVLILGLGWAARMRDAAVRLSKHRWAQGFSFVFLLLLATRLLSLPLGIYGHHVALSYGLSVQGWGSWLADKGKLFALEWGIGGLLAMLLFRVIRKSPVRWWFWFWMLAAVVFVAGVFVTPYVFDPIFNQFEPLARTDPALVERLEQVVARGGIAIPPDRMFLMRASAKSTELNAYVTGFGASKRVVVWDTTVARSAPDEIAFIFAHEMGHYVLGHVVLGVGLTCAGLLPLFWLGYHGVRLLLARYGARWRIPSQEDWGALPVLGLVLLTLSAISDPISNGISRMMEHNADVFGQEAMHGIVADPQGVGLRTFQVLGEDSLDDPTPHPAFDWWFDTHPTVRFRAAFAQAYDPWAAGEAPKYFAK